MRDRLADLDVRRMQWQRAIEAARGLSYAEIVRACEEASKEAVLADRREVSTDPLVHALEERRARRR